MMAMTDLRCICGHFHSSSTDGEDTGCRERCGCERWRKLLEHIEPDQEWPKPSIPTANEDELTRTRNSELEEWKQRFRDERDARAVLLGRMNRLIESHANHSPDCAMRQNHTGCVPCTCGLDTERDALKADNERLREALKWLLDVSKSCNPNYEILSGSDAIECGKQLRKCQADARAALSRLGGDEEGCGDESCAECQKGREQ